MKKRRLNYNHLLIILFTMISCKQTNSNNVNITIKTEVQDLAFPLDLLPGSKFYEINSNKVKEVKSGYYKSISDIFLSKHTLKKSANTKFYVKYFENRIKIYDTFQYEINGNCNEGLPRMDCYYFDGRYAVLTNEDEYRRMIVDLSKGIIFLVDYNQEDKTKINNIIYFDNILNPILFIENKNEKLSFNRIDDGKSKKIVFSEFKPTIKQEFNNLSYRNIILIHKLFKGNDFIEENSITKDNLPHYFFP